MRIRFRGRGMISSATRSVDDRLIPLVVVEGSVCLGRCVYHLPYTAIDCVASDGQPGNYERAAWGLWRPNPEVLDGFGQKTDAVFSDVRSSFVRIEWKK